MLQEQPTAITEEYPYKFLFAALFESALDFPKRITEDIVAGTQYALSTLEKAERELLLLRYKERKSISDIAAHFIMSESNVRKIEARAFEKLRLPSRWNYIRHGIAGYMKKRIGEEYHKGYLSGYCDGYENGAEDARNGIPKICAPEKILDKPIEAMGLSSLAYNCLHHAGLKFVRDVVYLSSDRIRVMRNLGAKKASEIATAIQNYGIIHTAWDKYRLK